MPTYEYQCDACGHQFERFQSIKAPAIRKCPACGRLRVKRLISGGGGLIFKGSGFYITDYRSEGYKKEAGKEKAKAPTATSDSSDSKKESKSDAPKPKSDEKAAE